MEKPFISIVIPTWREDKVLRRCLSSLFAQEYPQNKFEIILVSKKNLSLPKGRIKIIKIKRHINHALARNIGVSHASGEIIAFCDDGMVNILG